MFVSYVTILRVRYVLLFERLQIRIYKTQILQVRFLKCGSFIREVYKIIDCITHITGIISKNNYFKNGEISIYVK